MNLSQLMTDEIKYCMYHQFYYVIIQANRVIPVRKNHDIYRLLG